MKSYSKKEIEDLNLKVSIPDFLVLLGADRKNIRKLGNKLDYRVNAFYRGGDNMHGCGVTFNAERKKYLCTDFTQKCFSNIDLLDLATKFCKVTFQQALEYLEKCSTGKQIDFSKGKIWEGKEVVPIDETIMNTFHSGLHPYLYGRGYTPETAEYFNLGWSLYGEMDERITIPIYDKNGKLVSVQGRSYVGEEPKYLFLSGTGDNAKNTLYNLHNALPEAQKRGWILVVEGCPSVWRMHQYGLNNVVATCSTTVTDQQITLLKDLGLKIVIFFDWDENQAGQYGALKLLKNLKERNVKNVNLVNTKFPSSPDDMPKSEVFKFIRESKKIL